MNRRVLLQWTSGLLSATSAFLVGIPGLGFFLSGVRRSGGKRPVVQRVARVRDLAPGKPVQVSVLGSRHDAWTLHPEEVIGRVWLVRSESDLKDDRPPKVTALTAICPHLGCLIGLDARGRHFVCPCHRAAFGLDGEKITERQLKQPNHAPRGMDSLQCQLVKDEGDDDWWVEVKYEQFEQGLTKKVCKA
jgi:menaquinol-cytochrome c reductase iron-sulfur subunit